MSGEARRLTDTERLDWLRLIRSENIGPRTFWGLIGHYGSAARALATLPDLAKRGGAPRTIRIASRQDAERELDALRRIGAAFVARGEPDYPDALAAIDSAPPLIATRGNVAVFRRPVVALVGSRNASAAGLTFADRLARGLAEAGFVIASGLARGIDARAHAASLEGGTIAVLAGGHDRLYPPDHAPLLARLLERGAALTEMPMGWEPRGRDFPRRNRLVAGLALGTVVIEAARRSGSLITARFANEQGREVFAVPGSPLDPRAEGTNELLRQGATVCTRAEDVIDALQPVIAKGVAPQRRPGLFDPLHADAAFAWDDPGPLEQAAAGGARDDGDRAQSGGVAQRVAALLGFAPIGIDDLARAADAPIREVNLAVLELELAGRVGRHAGNLVSLLVEDKKPNRG
jgi:DNA processing protein